MILRVVASSPRMRKGWSIQEQGDLLARKASDFGQAAASALESAFTSFFPTIETPGARTYAFFHKEGAAAVGSLHLAPLDMHPTFRQISSKYPVNLLKRFLISSTYSSHI